MGTRCIANECLGTTGFSYTLSLINGKYKMTILYTLMEFGVVRFNEMKKYIGGISYKTLSATLKELEADGLDHPGKGPSRTSGSIRYPGCRKQRHHGTAFKRYPGRPDLPEQSHRR